MGGIHDNDRRLADHFGGKLHLGFIQIRGKLDKLLVTHEDSKNARREARLKDSDYSSDRTSSDKQNGLDKDRDRRRRERDRDRERDRRRTRSRSRSHERRSGSRRERSRSRDRYRSSRSHKRSYSRERRRRSRSRSSKERDRMDREHTNGSSKS